MNTLFKDTRTTKLVQFEKEGIAHILKSREGFFERITQCGIEHEFYKDIHYMKLWKVAEVDNAVLKNICRSCLKEYLEKQIENFQIHDNFKKMDKPYVANQQF